MILNSKKIKLTSLLLLLALSSFSVTKVIAFEFNKEYQCTIQYGGNSSHVAFLQVSTAGKIQNSDMYSPEIINMFKAGKCQLQKAKHYECRYPSGSWYVTLSESGSSAQGMGGNGHDGNSAKNDARAGKCQLIRQD